MTAIAYNTHMATRRVPISAPLPRTVAARLNKLAEIWANSTDGFDLYAAISAVATLPPITKEDLHDLTPPEPPRDRSRPHRGHTKESKKNRSQMMKDLWKDPAYRASQQAAYARARAKGKKYPKQSEAQKKLWQKPAYRAHILARIRSPEVRAQKSARVKKLWQDPDYRAKQDIVISRRGPRKQDGK